MAPVAPRQVGLGRSRWPELSADVTGRLDAITDAMADILAAEAARTLATDRLRVGHVLAIHAHLRALVAGGAIFEDGADRVADALDDMMADARAWEAAKKKPARVRRGS